MDSSASDSTKEIACATYFSKFSEKKEKKKMIITLVNILLHICFITFLMNVKKFKRKSNSVSVNFLKTKWYGLCENAWFPWQPLIQ